MVYNLSVSVEPEKNPWNAYYQERISSFACSSGIYEGMVLSLARQNDRLLAVDRPRTFLLGGFHPYNGTPLQFQSFCRRIHPNPNDSLVLLDMNEEPVANAPDNVVTIHSSLETSPFTEASVDLVFLDFTAEFMNDAQVAAFSERISQQLSSDGVLIILKAFNGMPLLSRNLAQYIPNYSRALQHLISLFDTLKTVSFASLFSDGKSFIALAKHGSPYKESFPDFSALREKRINA